MVKGVMKMEQYNLVKNTLDQIPQRILTGLIR